jgi:hypothetical protein
MKSGTALFDHLTQGGLGQCPEEEKRWKLIIKW